jgi:hypothetical protein
MDFGAGETLRAHPETWRLSIFLEAAPGRPEFSRASFARVRIFFDARYPAQ